MKKSTVKSVLVMAVLMLALFSMQIAVFAQDAEPTATFVPSEEGVLTIWSDQDRLPAIEALADSFSEQYGVEVRIQTMGFGDIRNNLVLGGPVGQGPDIIIGAHDWIGQLYSNGLIAALDLPQEILDNLDPVALRAFTYDGELVGLPYLTEAVALIYNTDLLPELPATWAELTDVVEQLVADGEAERGLAIPNSSGDPYHHEALLTGFGGYIFGVDEEGNYNAEDVGIDSEGGVAAMTELDRLVKADILNAAVDGGVAQNLFTEGQLAAWITGPWSLNAVRESGVPYAVAPIPEMEETPRPFVGSQGFMINAFSENALLAQAFLSEFVATDEGMQLLYDTIPFIPAWNPLAETTDNEDLANFRLSVANGDPMPAIPAMNAVWTAWGNGITLVYQQQADPETVVADAAGAIRDEIAGSGS